MTNDATSDLATIEEGITSPTLLIDKERCRNNIHRMAAVAQESGLRFRPHCKTHASLEIARWLRSPRQQQVNNSNGKIVTGITVSSLRMAEYFAPEWDDITVAFPVNLREMKTIERLLLESNNGKMKLNLLVENTEVVRALERTLSSKNYPKVGIYLKIDVGNGRTGIPFPSDQATDRIDEILHLLQQSGNSNLEWLGFLAHFGNTYGCRSAEEIRDVFDVSKQRLMQLRDLYSSPGQPRPQVSMGDTPSCAVVPPEEMRGCFDEMRPGVFCFYDLMQAAIGACTLDDIAVAVACPVVAKHPDRRELVVYGGGVHFSKESHVENNGIVTYGQVVRKKATTWGSAVDGMYMRKLSQEHGIIVVPPTEEWTDYAVGDLVYVLPVHSCMTADCLKHQGYLTTDGQVIKRMEN